MDIAREICTDSFYTVNSGLPRVPLTAVNIVVNNVYECIQKRERVFNIIVNIIANIVVNIVIIIIVNIVVNIVVNTVVNIGVTLSPTSLST